VRSKACLEDSFVGAEIAALDKPEGPATALLVRIEAPGFSGEPNDFPGALKGVAKALLLPTLVEVGVRPSPTRRCGAGVLISMGCIFLADTKLGVMHPVWRVTILVVARSGVLNADDGSASLTGR
jgi:hypothetical protein